MNIQTLLTQLRDLIARNELPAALTQLRTLLDNSPLLDDVILQSGRFHAIRQQIRLGVVSHAEATLTQNQIRAGLLDLSGRFHAIRQQIRLGVVSHAEATLTQNQIRAGLLDLLLEVEQHVGITSSAADTNAALRLEVERAISIVESKNVVVGSTISAGGNVHIGDSIINNEGATIKNQFNGGTFNNTTFE
jgi:hypothetical protein